MPLHRLAGSARRDFSQIYGKVRPLRLHRVVPGKLLSGGTRDDFNCTGLSRRRNSKHTGHASYSEETLHGPPICQHKTSRVIIPLHSTFTLLISYRPSFSGAAMASRQGRRWPAAWIHLAVRTEDRFRRPIKVEAEHIRTLQFADTHVGPFHLEGQRRASLHRSLVRQFAQNEAGPGQTSQFSAGTRPMLSLIKVTWFWSMKSTAASNDQWRDWRYA
jgi:hypothetical protein